MVSAAMPRRLGRNADHSPAPRKATTCGKYVATLLTDARIIVSLGVERCRLISIEPSDNHPEY